MKKYIIFIPILLLAAGCIFIKKDTIKNIPLKPSMPWELLDRAQQSADVANQIAVIIHTSGASAYSYETNTLKEQTGALKLILGNPTEFIDWTDRKKTRILVKEIRRLEQQRRDAVRQWEDTITDLATQKEVVSKLQKANGSLMNWIWGLGIGLALLCFFFPTIGVPLIVWLFKRARKLAQTAATETAGALKDQTKQVVSAIEEYKTGIKETNPEEYNKLKDTLERHTDVSTRKLVKELKP